MIVIRDLDPSEVAVDVSVTWDALKHGTLTPELRKWECLI